MSTTTLLLLLAAAPGQLLWEAKVPPRDLVGMAEANGVVVTGSHTGDGGLFAFDGATGRPLWSKRKGEQTACIPAMDGKRVYVVLGNQPTKRLAAFDPRTGKELWSVTGSYKLGNAGGPLTDGARVYLLNGDGTLTAHDAATGKQVWSLDWGGEDPYCPSGLALRDGLLSFGGGRFWMGPSKGRPKALWGVDAATGRERWRYVSRPADGGECYTTPVFAAGRVVATSHHTILAVDAASGALQWRHEVVRKVGELPKERPLSQAAVSGGVVFAAFDEAIAAVSLASGQPLPDVPATTDVNQQVVRMTERDGVLYFIGRMAAEDTPLRYVLHAYDVASRRVLWTHRTSRPVKSFEDWRTTKVLPTAGGVYYENAKLLAKVAR